MRDDDAILKAWYAGEVGGEALFSTLAKRAPPEAARKWLALAAVEAAVASRLAAVLASRHVPIPLIEHAQQRAQQRCDAIAGEPWPQTMRWLYGIAAAALHKMRAAAAELPAELEAIGDLVVRHEAALVAFAERELAGDEAHSLQPIEAFLGAPA